jgi:hypothetical protein
VEVTFTHLDLAGQASTAPFWGITQVEIALTIFKVHREGEFNIFLISDLELVDAAKSIHHSFAILVDGICQIHKYFFAPWVFDLFYVSQVTV